MNSQRAWMVLNQQAQVKKQRNEYSRDSERKFLKYRRNLEKWERDSVTFDDNGISKINGEPTDQVVDRFNHEFGYLSSSVHSTAPSWCFSNEFFPAGQEFPHH